MNKKYIDYLGPTSINSFNTDLEKHLRINNNINIIKTLTFVHQNCKIKKLFFLLLIVVYFYFCNCLVYRLYKIILYLQH